MTTKKKEAEQPTPESNEEDAGGMFAMFSEVDEATGGGDINNLELKVGDNCFRVLQRPMLIRKHWDCPSSSEATAIPCRKRITDLKAYAKDPKGYLEAAEKCEYCEWAEEHPGFYTVKDHWIFNVVQTEESTVDGKKVEKPIVKIAEFTQKSILREIAKFENNEKWKPLMPNGIQDIEIIVTKEQKPGGGKQNVKYSVGGNPTSRPLPPEQRSEEHTSELQSH